MDTTNQAASASGEATTEQAKDTLIFVKSKSVGQDSKGRTKVDLRFSESETAQIKEELAKINSRVKLQIHIDLEEEQSSAFIFIKEVQEKGAAFGTKKPAFGPKTSASPAVSDKVAALKGLKK